MLKNYSESYPRSIFQVCRGYLYYLGLFNYLSSCLLNYLLVSGHSGKWMEKWGALVIFCKPIYKHF